MVSVCACACNSASVVYVVKSQLYRRLIVNMILKNRRLKAMVLSYRLVVISGGVN